VAALGSDLLLGQPRVPALHSDVPGLRDLAGSPSAARRARTAELRGAAAAGHLRLRRLTWIPRSPRSACCSRMRRISPTGAGVGACPVRRPRSWWSASRSGSPCSGWT
jgi:hypothetical protein